MSKKYACAHCIWKHLYLVRDHQVILDYDLAFFLEMKRYAIRSTVRRHKDVFSQGFCFCLTKQEYKLLQEKWNVETDQAYRALPYAFTRHGISVLSGMMHRSVNTEMTVQILKAFDENMRMIADYTAMVERIQALEMKLAAQHTQVEKKISEISSCIHERSPSQQKVFFGGQIFDAFELLISLVQKARKRIVLIDGYVDTGTLNILAKKAKNVNVIIYTFPSARLTKRDIKTFNRQYPPLCVKRMTDFHDRFLILDDAAGYHIGASIKDAGRKCFGITEILDTRTIKEILSHLEKAGGNP